MVTHRQENKNFVFIDQSKLNNAKLFSDRLTSLPVIPDGGLYLELGVGGGDYTRWLLNNKNFDRSDLMDKFDEPCARYGRWTAENHEQYVQNLLKDKNIKTIKGRIEDTIDSLTDKYRYIYIDASQDYESVSYYLNKCSNILENDGVIGINDYTFWGWFEQEEYGCVEAVNKFLENRVSWSVVGYALGYCGYSDIYIKKSYVFPH